MTSRSPSRQKCKLFFDPCCRLQNTAYNTRYTHAQWSKRRQRRTCLQVYEGSPTWYHGVSREWKWRSVCTNTASYSMKRVKWNFEVSFSLYGCIWVVLTHVVIEILDWSSRQRCQAILVGDWAQRYRCRYWKAVVMDPHPSPDQYPHSDVSTISPRFLTWTKSYKTLWH